MKRIKNDKYYTEAKLTKVLLDNIDIYGNVFEPCAGNRDISRALEEHIYSGVHADRSAIFSSDLTDESEALYPGDPDDFPKDATTKEFWEAYKASGFDWTVTNPPFNLAPRIIPLAYEYSNRGIAMLLRLTYLEPCGNRAQWLAENADQLRCVIPVNPRPKFRGDSKGTDSCTVAWFVWDKWHSWEALGADCPFVFAAGWNK